MEISASTTAPLLLEVDLKRNGRIPKWNLTGRTRGKRLLEGWGRFHVPLGTKRPGDHVQIHIPQLLSVPLRDSLLSPGQPYLGTGALPSNEVEKWEHIAHTLSQMQTV